MHHIHFKECGSTQYFLFNNIEDLINNHKNVLVSTDQQTDGVGRSSHKWIQFKNALAFSFTLSPNPIQTLTPLEIGVLVCDYFKEVHRTNLLLKWPNDIVTAKFEKCGGIISTLKNNIVISGIGLNFGIKDQNYHIESLKIPVGTIFNKEIDSEDKRYLSNDIYTYILNNRISENLVERWNTYCAHLNHDVSIVDQESNIEGTFLGIDKNGVANIKEKKSNTIIKIYAGSLIPLKR